MNCSNDGGTSDANDGTLGPNPIGSVVLFLPIKKEIILSSIPSFSQRAGTRQDFLNILAGLCLLVPSLETATDKFKKEYYNTNGIKLLRESAKQLANRQKTREKTQNDVAKAITQLRQYPSCSKRGWGISGQTAYKERQYALLRAHVFQTWLESKTLAGLQYYVVSAIYGSANNIPTEIDTNI